MRRRAGSLSLGCIVLLNNDRSWSLSLGALGGFAHSTSKMTRALIYSLAACAVSVALEGLFAGRGIKQRLAQLRVPRYVPPVWGWVVIGALYYLICFVVLYRVFSMSETIP